MANFINIGSAGFSKSERGPIDKNIVFNDVSAMNTFVSASSGTAYAGQIISIADNQKALYKVIQSGSTYSTINLLDISSGSGTDPAPVETSPEIFDVSVLYTDISTGFGGFFTGEGFEFETGLADDMAYANVRIFYKDLCKYLGLIDTWASPNIDYSANPEWPNKILKIDITDFSFTTPYGYIIPDVYKSSVVINNENFPCWILTYTYNNILWTWKIADDSDNPQGPQNKPIYPFAVYKFIPVIERESLTELEVIDLD